MNKFLNTIKQPNFILPRSVAFKRHSSSYNLKLNPWFITGFSYEVR